MDAVGALVCGMGRFFLLQWHSPAGISNTDDCHSKSGACCSGINVPDEDAGTGYSIESSDSEGFFRDEFFKKSFLYNPFTNVITLSSDHQ